MIFKPKQGDDAERSMRKIETIKKELYVQIRRQVSDRLGLQDREIKKSEKSFNRFFSRSWKKSSTLALQKQIENSNLIFWGDFHGVREFQKNFLRWIKKQDLTQSPIVVALECLPSQTQKWVDLYLDRQISEEDFLKKVKWDQAWGFPWWHYKPIFEWARDHQQILRVINSPSARSTSKQRESKGLKLLADVLVQVPNSRIFVLYGEYHLLPQGFPSLVKKKKKIKPLFVFQNSEALYFSKPFFQKDSEGAVFQSRSRGFCIQNVSPWVKWQNYNLFLESSQDLEFEEDLDLTEHILGLSKILSQVLKIPLDPGSISIFTNIDRALWDHLRKLPEQKLIFFKNLIEQNLSFVDPSGGWAYLGRISANEAASIAMQILFFQMNKKMDWESQNPFHWEHLIWAQAFSYFGSKVINPHRKSATLLDLQKKSKTAASGPVERQAARLAVHYTLHQSLGFPASFQENSMSRQVRFQAVKWISGLLGEKLYQEYSKGTLSLSNLKTLMAKNSFDKKNQFIVQN